LSYRSQTDWKNPANLRIRSAQRKRRSKTLLALRRKQ
jgi:hypothetical protein